MKLIIHAGMHKTGTTSFQEFMFKNSDLLFNKGIYYPKSIDAAYFPNQHSDIAFLLMQGNVVAVKEYFQSIANASNDNNCILLSGEEFSSIGDSETTLLQLKDILEEISLTYEIVLVVRRAEKQLASILAEFFIHGNFIGERHYLLERTVKQLKMNAKIIFNYKKIFDEKLVLISFRELTNHPDELINALLYKMTGVFLADKLVNIHSNTSKENLSNVTTVLLSPMRSIIAAAYQQPVEAPSNYDLLNTFVDVKLVSTLIKEEKVEEFVKICQSLFSDLSKEACNISKENINSLFENYPLELDLFWNG